MSSKGQGAKPSSRVIVEKGAGGGAVELELLSMMTVPRNHPSRNEHQKENKLMARQCGDVREKLPGSSFCQWCNGPGVQGRRRHSYAEALGLATSYTTFS